MNTIAATSASGATLIFTADAVAGAPSQLEKVDGDAQVASPGVALGAHPQVRVSDAYGNTVAGVTVTFVVEAGGGSVSAPVVVSDRAGIARSGAWVLGPPGVQRMVARAGELASEPFTARAVTPPFGCVPSDALLTQANAQAELTALSCKGTDGRSLDAYTIVVTKPGAYVFTLTSVEFDADLELRGAGLVELARNDYGRPTTNSGIKVLLPQGTYTLVVSSSKLGAGGSYSLAYRPAGSDVESCEEAFIVRGITVRGVVYASDCNVSPNEFADRFRIYLEAGSQAEIQVEDWSYSGPNVRIVSPDGSIAEAGPGGDYLTTLGYLAPVNGYYTVLVGLVPGESGTQYAITVR